MKTKQGPTAPHLTHGLVSQSHSDFVYIFHFKGYCIIISKATTSIFLGSLFMHLNKKNALWILIIHNSALGVDELSKEIFQTLI